MKKKIVALSIVIGLFVFACGCIEEEKKVEVGTGVTFSEIRLFKQTDDDNDSYITVMSESKTVDLISLNLSHINETLGVIEIEVGNYSKLWINVTSAIGVLNETKETVNISVPSGWLKIQQLHLFNIQKGNNTITVDIDLENSMHMFHGGEEYKFIPVIGSLEHRHENKLQFREHNKSKIRNMIGNRKLTLTANETYEFNASGTLDVDGDDMTFLWDFGDGTNVTGDVVTHSYTDEQKTYQLWLTVSDGHDEAKWHVTVKINS